MSIFAHIISTEYSNEEAFGKIDMKKNYFTLLKFSHFMFLEESKTPIPADKIIILYIAPVNIF